MIPAGRQFCRGRLDGRRFLTCPGFKAGEGVPLGGRVLRLRIDTRQWQVLVWFRKYRVNFGEHHPTSGQSLSGEFGGTLLADA